MPPFRPINIALVGPRQDGSPRGAVGDRGVVEGWSEAEGKRGERRRGGGDGGGG